MEAQAWVEETKKEDKKRRSQGTGSDKNSGMRSAKIPTTTFFSFRTMYFSVCPSIQFRRKMTYIEQKGKGGTAFLLLNYLHVDSSNICVLSFLYCIIGYVRYTCGYYYWQCFSPQIFAQ
jgi:hypothetical protein